MQCNAVFLSSGKVTVGAREGLFTRMHHIMPPESEFIGEQFDTDGTCIWRTTGQIKLTECEHIITGVVMQCRDRGKVFHWQQDLQIFR